ncbi:unnamed protein product [Alternaria alternata]
MVEPLSSAHVRCSLAFKALVHTVEEPIRNIQDQIVPEDIHNEFDKYNIWAGNVGAAHSGRREQEEGSDSESSTHCDLGEDWEEGGEEFEDSPWEVSSDSSNGSKISSQHQPTHQRSNQLRPGLSVSHNPASNMSRLVESIRFIINCLYRLPIRKPAPLDRIEHRISTDSALYQHFDVLYVKDKFPHLEHQVATRLGKMITRRRQILNYREAHRQSLDVPNVQLQIAPGPQGWLTSSVSEGDLENIVGDHSSRGTSGRLASSQTASSHFTLRSKATTARPEKSTLPVSQESMDMLFAPSLAETNSTAASSYAGKDLRVDVPSRPRSDDGRKLGQFECPYCLLTKDISNDRRWRKHVFEDLQPYVCTYGNCDLYDHFFEGRDAWFNHELQHHRTKWFCNVDGHAEYDSEEDFLLHMQTGHDQKFGGIQFSLVKAMFRRPTKNLAGTCNLCHRDSKSLQSHLSRHLQQMAMFALPRANENTGSAQAERDTESSRYKSYRLSDGGTSGSSSSSSVGVPSNQLSALNLPNSDICELEIDHDAGDNIPDIVGDQGWDNVTDKFSKARERAFRRLRVMIVDMSAESREKMAALVERLQVELMTTAGHYNSAADVVRNHISPDVVIIGEVLGPNALTRSIHQIRDATDVPVVAVRQSVSDLKTLSNFSNWMELLEPSQNDIEEAFGRLCQWAPAPPHWRPATPIHSVDGSLSTLSDRSGQSQMSRDGIMQHAQDLLSLLPHAEDAPFNTFAKQHEPVCLADTRVDLLREIHSWADGQDERCVFWLSGLAGTGKSTIARTVARQYHNKQRLAASFFFSRGGGDVEDAGKFVTSLAVQLARNVPSVKQLISDAIAERDDIASQSLRDQWHHLIISPLSKLSDSSRPASLMLVVDALDECDSDSNIRIIVQLLAEARSLTRARLRVLLTSRSEVPIRHGFYQVPEAGHQDVVLHNISRSIVDHDITLFLQHNLQLIARECCLRAGWPGAETLVQLVQSASGLFIWAATACRFIREGKRFAARRLETILRNDGKAAAAPEKHLNEIYTTVLENSIQEYTDEEKEEQCRAIRYILGSIVALFSPLSAQSLDQLLDVAEGVRPTLEDLHAILDIPNSQSRPLRLHHPSFRDFLLDQKRCGDRFYVDESSTHENLARRCREFMSAPDGLRQDMCNLLDPGVLRTEIDEENVDRNLLPELQYACRYWVDHLERSGCSIEDGDATHRFLETHLLHWLEAMSLINETSLCVRLVARLQALAKPSDSTVAHFLQDASRFVLRFVPILAEAPLQIYSSALLFSPEASVVRKVFIAQVPQTVEVLSGRDAEWDACRSVLEGHSREVSAVMFSPDRQLVASASWDRTVRVWETATGTCRHELKGHTDGVNAVVFSRDGQLVASASDDSTVRVWETATGACRSVLEGHSGYVSAVMFSPDGQLVASASGDRTVRVWETATGACRSVLEGHSDSVSAVVFSPDGQLVASASWDRTVRVWETATGACRSVLQGHSGYVSAVMFSPDGQLVASASEDRTVRVWETATGACRSVLEGHSREVSAVVFSLDGQLVASASWDNTVRVWETATGACRSVLHQPSPISRIAFSPDGRTLHTNLFFNTKNRLLLQ